LCPKVAGFLLPPASLAWLQLVRSRNVRSPSWVGRPVRRCQEGKHACFHPNGVSLEVMEALVGVLGLPLPREAAPAHFSHSWNWQVALPAGLGGRWGSQPTPGKVPSARVSCGVRSFRHPGRGHAGGGEEACPRVGGGPPGLAHTAPCLLSGGGFHWGSTPTTPPCDTKNACLAWCRTT